MPLLALLPAPRRPAVKRVVGKLTPHYRSAAGWYAIVTSVAILVCVADQARSDYTLSDFNGSGFTYTFDDFTQTTGPTSVRLTDPTNGWGGGGVNVGLLDLSAFANDRLVVDFEVEPGNQTTQFDIELLDVNDNSGKWTFDLSSSAVGQPTTRIASTTLSDPQSGIGQYWNLDLSQIETWQVLGHFGSSSPFDVSFGRVATSGSEAPPAYPGAEPDAAWRSVAATRIDANRKADLSVAVVDLAGNPVPNAAVDVSMQQHEFGFGSAVQAYRLRDNAPQHEEYKSRVREMFNVATLENNLKWQPWEGEWGGQWTQAGALAALGWLAQNGIDARGHVMVWPGESNLPADLSAMIDGSPLTPSEQQTVRDRISQHIAAVGGATQGSVVAWDVVNETRTNNDLMNLLSEGDQAIVDWFALAAGAVADADLYINDFGILSSGGATSTFNQNQYFNTVEQLVNQGAEIDGIGFQGHFRDQELTGPEQLWTILDRFEQLGLKMQVTEFDYETTDEQLQAQYTRDFLTAMFAHQGVSDVIHWGFWEDAHWRPDAALFRSDWSTKPNGQAFLDLVFGEWWTEETLESDATGQASLRGFKGDYAVSADAYGVSQSVFTLLTGSEGSVVVTLPVLVGDYNKDGAVDAADYVVWRDSLGSTSDLSADGNNDGVVDASDYNIWRARFGATAAAPQSAATAPEPGATGLLVLAFTACWRARARRMQTP